MSTPEIILEKEFNKQTDTISLNDADKHRFDTLFQYFFKLLAKEYGVNVNDPKLSSILSVTLDSTHKLMLNTKKENMEKNEHFETSKPHYVDNEGEFIRLDIINALTSLSVDKYFLNAEENYSVESRAVDLCNLVLSNALLTPGKLAKTALETYPNMLDDELKERLDTYIKKKQYKVGAYLKSKDNNDLNLYRLKKNDEGLYEVINDSDLQTVIDGYELAYIMNCFDVIVKN